MLPLLSRRQEVKGKQVQILCDLVTVSGKYSRSKPLRKREGAAVRGPGSQETCRSLVQGVKPGLRGIGHAEQNRIIRWLRFCKRDLPRTEGLFFCLAGGELEVCKWNAQCPE